MNRYRIVFMSISDPAVKVSVLLDAKSRRGAYSQFFNGFGTRWGTNAHLSRIETLLNEPFTLTAVKR